MLFILFSAISLATWKVHRAKKQEIKIKSEVFQETQQLRKEMKIAVKIRGINGDNRISRIHREAGKGVEAAREAWGAGLHRVDRSKGVDLRL